MKAMERLYLTADRRALVRQGDPAAATLYAIPGDTIPESTAERFGLVAGRLPDGAPEEEMPQQGAGEPRPAARAPAGNKAPAKAKGGKSGANKQVSAPANKEVPAPDDKSAPTGAGEG
ncbi:MAG: hypothetical protein ACOY45_09605 [Pseudomonadota bacterium]